MVPLFLDPLLRFLEPCWSRNMVDYSVIYGDAQPSHQGACGCHGLFCAIVSFIGC
jgi:hypothetical protein